MRSRPFAFLALNLHTLYTHARPLTREGAVVARKHVTFPLKFLSAKEQRKLKGAIKASRQANLRPTVIVMLYTRIEATTYFTLINPAAHPEQEKPVQGGIEECRDSDNITTAAAKELLEEVGLIIRPATARVEAIGAPFDILKDMEKPWIGKRYFPIRIYADSGILRRKVRIEADNKTGQLKILGMRWVASIEQAERCMAANVEIKKNNLLPLVRQIFANEPWTHHQIQ